MDVILMKQMKDYENELITILNADKSNWAKFYLLMKEIEEKQLYRELNLNSFTAWVKSFSIKNKIHESVIWNRKKAGKVYENYVLVQKEKGIEVAPLEKAKIGVDSLVLLDKISKRDKNLGAQLTEKAIQKEISREDLRNAYKTIRGDLQKNKADDKKTITLSEKAEESIIKIKETIAASKIVAALAKPRWLGEECNRKAFKGAYEQDKYKALTEFPVYTGTTSKSRRIDVLVAENLRVKEHFNLNLHGIEIKVSKSDLVNDIKYTEYAEFVNYLWLAIPEDLLEVAEIVVPKNIGILIYKNDRINIKREAETLEPLKLKESLTTLSLRLL